MNVYLEVVLLSFVAYLIGAIPFSFLIAKLKGVDLRKVGSGNIGATNVLRSCGRVAGFWAYLLDIGKGPLACFLVDLLSRHYFSGVVIDFQWQHYLFIAPYFLAIVGHLYPIYLGFKGGKGVATSAGVLVYLFPWPLLMTAILFLAIFLIWRIISLASIVSAILLPFIMTVHHLWLNSLASFLSYEGAVKNGNFKLLLLLVTALSLFVVYKHKPNIERLLRGEEHSFKKK